MNNNTFSTPKADPMTQSREGLREAASDIFQHGWFCGRERGGKGTDEQAERDWRVHADKHTDAIHALYASVGGVGVERLIEELRQSEGAALTILCDNPDFNGLPNNAVEIVAEWTNWQTVRFTGESLLEALVNARHMRGGTVMAEGCEPGPGVVDETLVGRLQGGTLQMALGDLSGPEESISYVRRTLDRCLAALANPAPSEREGER